MKYTEKNVQVPYCSATTTNTLANKTGSWRFAQPVFQDMISPCAQRCPLGNDIGGFMYLAGQGRFEEAWKLIMQEHPFPATVGRICYHPCENECNRAHHDEPVSIKSVERFIGDYGLERGLTVGILEKDKRNKVAVVGGGPAGLSAAYQLRLMGYPVTVFDSNEHPGGLMRYGIPAYRLSNHVLAGEIERLIQMGINFKSKQKVGRDISWDELSNDFEAFFLAPGSQKEGRLRIEGMELEGVHKALNFLSQVNRGKPPKIGKKTVVIGGGNSAIDCARVARRLGSEVTVLYRRSEAEMPAHEQQVQSAKDEGVQFTLLSIPVAVKGNKAISGLKVERMQLGAADSSGRHRPVPTGETVDLNLDTMIVAIGERPSFGELPADLDCDKDTVATDPWGRTTRSGVFAGGDIINIPNTVTHALGSGKRAAVAIDQSLRGSKLEPSQFDRFRLGDSGNICLGRYHGNSLFPRRNQSQEIASYDRLNPFYFDRRPRLETQTLSPQERVKDFREVTASLTEKESLYEARRCFVCGSCTECGNCFIFCPDICVKKDLEKFGYRIDLDYCKGCGTCVQECPRGAMTMELMEEK